MAAASGGGFAIVGAAGMRRLVASNAADNSRAAVSSNRVPAASTGGSGDRPLRDTGRTAPFSGQRAGGREAKVGRAAAAATVKPKAKGSLSNNPVDLYARAIGLDPGVREDAALMWVAQKGSKAGLERGWSRETDKHTGKLVYVDKEGKKHKHHPQLKYYAQLVQYLQRVRGNGGGAALAGDSSPEQRAQGTDAAPASSKGEAPAPEPEPPEPELEAEAPKPKKKKKFRRGVLNLYGAKSNSSHAVLRIACDVLGWGQETLHNDKGTVFWVVTPDEMAERFPRLRTKSQVPTHNIYARRSTP